MKKCRLLLAAGLLMFLTGCFSQSVEEFYAPPKAPDDYLKLDNEINIRQGKDGEMELFTEDIPMWRYPIRPEGYKIPAGHVEEYYV